MLALQTRAVLNFLLGQQYAGIPKDTDTDNLQSLDARAPVVITQTKMESRVVVVPVPTTVVVTHYVPSSTAQDANSAALPTVSTPPARDVPPPREAPVADGDAPQFASFIPPTSQQISPVPTTAPSQEPPNEGPVDDGNAQFGTFVPITSQEVNPVPTTEPVQEPPTEVPANNGDAPQFASFIPPTSEEATPVPTTVPGQEPPAGVPVVDGDAPQFASFIPPTSREVNPVPTTVPGQEAEPAPPAPLPETTSSVYPIPQTTSQEVSQETTTSIGPIAEPISQEAPRETTEPTRPIDVPGPATTGVENPVQFSQPAAEETSLGGPDPVTTAAPNPSQSSTQATTQGGPGNTPENARLIIETESSSSLSATPTSEVLQFDTAPFTYTGPATRSTTLQTRRGTSTDASVADSTQTSDGFDDDDSETGVAGSEPLYTTATLADGVVTTIDLSATAGSDNSETESPDASVKDKSDSESNVPPMVVGSVLGSILGISMLAFVIFWLMRRRKLQRRRSTLLTPLGARPGAPPGNLMKYEIDNQSLGPTPRSTKVAASMSANAKKFSQRIRQSISDASHIGISRGNSQFGHESQAVPTAHAHSRASSTPGQQPQNGWWSELLGESNINDPPAAAPPMQQQGYDGRRTPSPNPFSDVNSSVAAPLGPFREYSHSVPPHGSMVPPPLHAARENDPFADGDSIMSPELARQSPTIYAGSERRSPSMSRNLTPQSTGDNMNLKPQEVWRGKVHSNPFDLELDTRVVPSMYGNIQQVPRHTVASSFYSTTNAVNNNNNHHQYASRQSRADSFTSKYTSGVSSVSEWPPVPPRVPSIYSRYGNDGTNFPVPARDFRSNNDDAWRHGNGNMM
ncbi:hypothetical protein FLAG1_03663 [Fusarium langsethiae]|uniref:Uncharacterized protein n=1 Tax=Fusarium langsethiae TaxID=179993 RepID=A0A0M9F0H5_FUSLA|nr:hypothetical protein FLAG1_03663 [Fusarium langsethiae]GKU00184.1 unnamed protein product [Fusarium langsethiae]GKU17813.1 unnamed protein product [Fusarium langsethiae]